MQEGGYSIKLQQDDWSKKQLRIRCVVSGVSVSLIFTFGRLESDRSQSRGRSASCGSTDTNPANSVAQLILVLIIVPTTCTANNALLALAMVYHKECLRA